MIAFPFLHPRVYGVDGFFAPPSPAMKRSEINRSLSQAAIFFARHGFTLPPFAHWPASEWRQHGPEADELRRQRLGWDVTDFNSGRFQSLGLTLFTLRNGSIDGSKPYAEKIMHVRQNQVTPWHCHARKTEDIINRGGPVAGRLAIQLHNRATDGGLAHTPVTVWCDGLRRELPAGATVVLGPGASITLKPFLYHTFHAVEGDALVGEVSSLNDDDDDNLFLDPLPRYPHIEADEPPLRLLCTEYPPA